MRDLTKTFWDGGQLRGMAHSAIIIADPGQPDLPELATFSNDCFDAMGNFRPEVLTWLRAIASEGEIPLPFGGLA